MSRWALFCVFLVGFAAEAVCICPNGVPTMTNATNTTNATLCEMSNSTVVVDCSSCNSGFQLSATPGLGLQTCVAADGSCDSPDCECPPGHTVQRNLTGSYLCIPWCDVQQIDLCDLAAAALLVRPFYYNHTDNFSYANDCLSLFPRGECLECASEQREITCRGRNCQQQAFCPPNFDEIPNATGAFIWPSCSYNITGDWPPANTKMSNAMCSRKCELFKFKPGNVTQCRKCMNGFWGPKCEECPGGHASPCNGHGNCNGDTGKCECHEGYYSEFCDRTEADCHNRGMPYLENGSIKCNCTPGSGWDPASDCKFCLNSSEWFYHNTTFVDRPEFCAYCAANGSTCNYHGRCNDPNNYNHCMCDPGYTGEFCQQCDYFYYPQGVNTSLCTPCMAPDKCRGHGVCNVTDGSCICDFPFAGTNGTCNSCLPGYWGPDCQACDGYVNNATPSCLGRGICDDGPDGTGTCTCDPGFAGSSCQFTSAQSCNNHGRVLATAKDTIIGCECDPGFAPPNCRSCLSDHFGPNCTRCEETCSGTGVFVGSGAKGRCQLNGTCLCDIAYTGVNCERCAAGRYDYPRCIMCNATSCSNHGSCAMDGTCNCSVGWTGSKCDECAPGFYGSACTPCQCGGNGRCLSGGACVCNSPFRGPNCQDPTIAMALPVRASTAGGTPVRLIGYYLLGNPSILVGGRSTNRTCSAAIVSPSPACTDCSEVTCILPAIDPNADGQALIVLTNGVGSAPFLYGLEPPFISSITFVGTASTTGVSVTLNGINFGEYATVNWDNATGVNIICNHTRLVFNAPAGTGSVPVFVTVGGQPSPTYYFTYAPPVVTGAASSITSTAGTGNLTITGSNFGTSVANTAVLVGNQACSVITTAENQITCDLPASYGDQAVVVTVSGQRSSVAQSGVFTYGAPTVTAVSGCPGGAAGCLQAMSSVITVDGTNFGSNAGALGSSGALTVTVGGVACTGVAVTITNTRLTCLLPAGGFGVNVPVAVSRVHPSGVVQIGTANLLSFEGPVLTPSTLTASPGTVNTSPYSVTVPNTLGTQTVIIHGLGFGTAPLNVAVHFFASDDPKKFATSFFTDCAVTAVIDTQITCTLGSGVGRNLIFQVNVAGLYSGYSRDVLSHPMPTAATANEASSIVTITGTHFGGAAFLEQIVVAYGPSADKSRYECIPLSATDGEIQCRYGGGPVGAMSFRISIGAFSSAATIEPAASIAGKLSPSIVSIALPPECTSGLCPTNSYDMDLRLNITVANVAGVPVVRMGPLYCSEIRVISPTLITCRIPNFSGKNYGLVVSEGVLSSTEAFSVSYKDPEITEVTGLCIDGVGEFICEGGEAITVSGKNFGPNTNQDLTVLIQGVPCVNVVKQLEGLLTCTLPVQLARTPSTIVVVQQSGELSNGITLNLYRGCNPGTFYDVTVDGCTGCPAGTFQASRGQSTCSACALGKYSSGSSAACTMCLSGRFSNDPVSGCQDAKPGTFCPKSGMAACLACPPGTYTATDGAESCLPCLAVKGQYSTGWKQTSCSTCTLGKYAAYNEQTSCDYCKPGYYTYNTAAQGTLVAGAPIITCNACPVGTFYNAALLPAFPCSNCSIGKFTSVPGALECSLCQQGTYGVSLGASSCLACPVGKAESGYGSLDCKDCLPGRYGNIVGLAFCFECPVSTWSNRTGNPSGCSNCPPGQETISTGQTQCQSCPVGKSVAGGGKRCAYCLPGKFANSSGMTQCVSASLDYSTANSAGATLQTVCPVGTEAPQPGSVVCNDCKVGYFNNRSGVGCQPCSPGTFIGVPRGVACSKCLPGFYAYQWGSDSCAPCPVGRFSSGNGSSDCISCPIGKIQPETGKSSCTNCINASTTWRLGATTCFTCPPGQQFNSTAAYGCSQCPRGKYRYGAPLEGIVNNETFDNGFCRTCPAGRIALDVGHSTCTECNPGYYCRNGTEQTACPEGTYAGVHGLSTCLPCEVGYFGIAGQPYCTQCFPGTYQDKPGKAACEDCEKDFPRGYGNSMFGAPIENNKDNRSYCFYTRKGFKLVGRFWERCPAGTDSSQDSFRGTCAPCAAGRFSDGKPGISDDGCSPCPIGKTQPAPGQTVCTDCAVGRYFKGPPLAGNPFCFACEAGTYADKAGLSICLACEPGRYAPAVGDHAEAGKGIGIVTCRQCTPGKYMNYLGSTDENCLDCEPGRYQDKFAGRDCELCHPGNYSGGFGFSTCSPCLLHTVAPDWGATNCTDCDDGEHWVETAIVCEACPPGKDLSSSADICNACERGKYNPPNSIFDACEPCPAGSFSEQPEQTSCTLCAVGRAQSNRGATSCDTCLNATYTNVTGSVNCTTCPPGRFGPTVEPHVGCELCELGKATDAYGIYESCTRCEPGRYADTRGQQNCTACPAGRASAVAASQVQCDQCQPGTFAAPAQSTCSECAAGRIAYEPGLENCSDCAFGVPSNVQRTVCLCPKDFYVDPSQKLSADNKVDCKPCPLGADCSAQGSLDCREDSLICQKQGVLTQSGYWRGSGMNFYRCLLPEHCCPGNGTVNCCNQNRGGFLCASCIHGTSANSILGACEPCPSQSSALAVTIVIVIVIFIAAVIMYFILLRADAALIKAMEDADKQALEWDNYHSTLHYENRREFARSVSMKSLNKSTSGDNVKKSKRRPGSRFDFTEQKDYDYRESPVAIPGQRHDVNYQNYTYKIKIIIGFLQINTSCVFQLKVPWPRVYETFINFFSIVNLDFVPWQNLSCVTPYTFYDKYLALTILPISAFILFCGLFVIFVKVWQCYLLSRQSAQGETVGAREEREAGERKVTRTIRKFWKLALFTIFLAFPGVCTKTLSFFLCLQNDNKFYLYADVNVECYDAMWYEHLTWAVFCIFLYPVAIPLGFLAVLLYYRNRFRDPGVKLQTGFLYDAYAPGLWWFEMIDIAHKLFMTSILAFVDRFSQMPVGLAVLGIYLILIVVIKPYTRTTDDSLHLTCQMELLMLCLAGYRLTNQSLEPLAEFGSQGISDFTGVILIMMTLIVLFIFVLFAVKAVRLLLFSWLAKRRQRLSGQPPAARLSIFQRATSFRASVAGDDRDSQSGVFVDEQSTLNLAVTEAAGPEAFEDIVKGGEQEKSYLSPLFAAQLQDTPTSLSRSRVNTHKSTTSPPASPRFRSRGDTIVLPPPSEPHPDSPMSPRVVVTDGSVKKSADGSVKKPADGSAKKPVDIPSPSSSSTPADFSVKNPAKSEDGSVKDIPSPPSSNTPADFSVKSPAKSEDGSVKKSDDGSNSPRR